MTGRVVFALIPVEAFASRLASFLGFGVASVKVFSVPQKLDSRSSVYGVFHESCCAFQKNSLKEFDRFCDSVSLHSNLELAAGYRGRFPFISGLLWVKNLLKIYCASDAQSEDFLPVGLSNYKCIQGKKKHR